MAASPCPCGSARDYAQCCRPAHEGAPAADAEALMRSRYSAYALGLRQYLSDSWHASTRPLDFELNTDAGVPTTWLGLSVKQHLQTAEDTAEVEFVARYRVGGGSAVRLHERSRFLREHGRWFYVDGQHL